MPKSIQEIFNTISSGSIRYTMIAALEKCHTARIESVGPLQEIYILAVTDSGGHVLKPIRSSSKDYMTHVHT